MRYQPLNDVIDPDVPAADAPVPEPEPDPDAPDDAYVIGRHGNMVLTLKGDASHDKDDNRPRAWVKPVAILSTVVFLALTVWNFSKLLQGPPVPPAPGPFQVKQALYMGAIRIEAFRREHGVTPESAHDVGLAAPYVYTRINPNFYLVALEIRGSKLEYDSTIPLERFFGSPQEMLKTEEKR